MPCHTLQITNCTCKNQEDHEQQNNLITVRKEYNFIFYLDFTLTSEDFRLNGAFFYLDFTLTSEDFRLIGAFFYLDFTLTSEDFRLNGAFFFHVPHVMVIAAKTKSYICA